VKPGSRALPLAAALMAAGAAHAAAQDYRLRLDSRVQSVAFRGVVLDSIPASQVVVGANGGLETPDGRAVTCIASAGYCMFYLPGDRLSSAPLVTSGDLTAWGFGLPGLSVRANARWTTDLTGDDHFPGTQPSVELLEAYAEYAGASLTGRLGRQHDAGRLGWIGFDGAALTARPLNGRLELTGYGGWGLARAADVPIASPSLNPLGEFQLPERQVTAGARAAWRGTRVELQAEYRREVDRSSDQFVSERAALAAVLRPVERFTITGGADYDLAQGWWGTADLTLRYDGSRVNADAGVRRYRPFFELWTIWGAFSPVGYTAIDGSLAVTPVQRLRLRASGERYWFDDSGAETGLATFENDGWRLSFSATVAPAPSVFVDGGFHEEFGPGASSRTWDARVSWQPREDLSVAAFGSALMRPLELRFDEAHVNAVGVDADYRVSDHLRVALSGARYFEDRRRPDPGALDWNQFRVQARITWLLGTDPDRLRLPPAIRGRRTAAP
jgi:hypothetical protein